MDDFFNWSGWFFALVGVIFGIIQLVKKNEYKRKYNIAIQNQNSNNTTLNADNGGIAVQDNKGGIHIGK